MKKFFFLISLSCLAIIGCNESNKKYEVKGDVPNASNGDMAYLQIQGSQGFEVKDSCVITDKEFKFEGTQADPVMAAVNILTTTGEVKPIVFVLEQGDIELDFDTISKAEGTPLNDVLSEYFAKRRVFDRRMEDLSRSYMSDYMSGKLTDSIFTTLKMNFDKEEIQVKNLTNSYIADNVENITGLYVFLSNNYLFSTQEQEAFIQQGGDFFMKDSRVKELSLSLQRLKNVAEGMSYIDLQMRSLDGKEVTLSQYIGKGNYVLLDFWASWCAPCRRTMPQLVALYNQFKSKKFQIVGISFDTEPDAWKDAVKEMKMTWPQMSDLKGWESQAAMLYAIQGIPHTILLSPDGTIIAKNLSEKDLTEKLNMLLK